MPDAAAAAAAVGYITYNMTECSERPNGERRAINLFYGTAVRRVPPWIEGALGLGSE